MPPSPTALAHAHAHLRAGRTHDAASLYEQILRETPDQADALTALGHLALQQGNVPRAETLLARALAAQPHVALAHLNHGLALRRLGRTAAALAAFTRAQELAPDLADARQQKGNLLKSLGRHAEAAAELAEAVRLAPDNPAAWLNLGVALLEGGARSDAIAAFQHATTLDPRRIEAHNILGHALFTAGRTGEAEAAFAAALRLNPAYPPTHNNLGRLCRAAGRLTEAIAHYRTALSSQPNASTHSNLLFLLNFLPDLSPTEIFREHRRWHECYAAALAPASHPRPAPGQEIRRLRVGYISPDFCHHAVAYFIEPVLAAHDRTRFEIFCYASVAAPDAFSARLRTHAEHWRDIARLDDESAANLIRQDQLDLLVDLAGHSAHHRLLVLARRPAPVQATWIGYPNTTGLATIDYRITDHVSDPVGKTEPWHTEQLVRLPENFSCYAPDPSAPAVNDLPATQPGAVTFGCFNKFAKITAPTISLWSRLLTRLPAARLLLKSQGLDDPSVAERVRSAFAEHGIDPARLDLNGQRLSVTDHLSLYHGVDLALDPFPYNGTTTTCEALWMGVPVLTLAGETHVARVGASLLTHTGLTDWIAATPDDFVERGVAAAHDLPRLADLRRGLRERLHHSPLCDAPKFTRHLEDAFTAMATRLTDQ